ncbi:MAG: hypothetical protein KTR31_41295 [Myxococcales bacterium]|nr:hypothetical protein [Myxococcales bacterium]
MRTTHWMAACACVGAGCFDDVNFGNVADAVFPSDFELDIDSAPTGLLKPAESTELESSWCWFVAADAGQLHLYSVGMDTGTIEDLGSYGAVEDGFFTAGLAYDGTSSLVMPARDNERASWVRLDLASGTLTASGNPRYHHAVSTIDGSLLVADSRRSSVYASFDDLVAETPAGELGGVGHASRYQVRQGISWGAWHAAGELVVRDLVADEDLGTLELQGFNAWVWGIGVTDRYVHVLDDGRYGLFGNHAPRVVRFDLQTGNKVGYVELWKPSDTLGAPGGLWCDG